MEKVDIRQEKPNFCPHLEENPEYDTIPYMNVSPFPFFSVVKSIPPRFSLLHWDYPLQDWVAWEKEGD